MPQLPKSVYAGSRRITPAGLNPHDAYTFYKGEGCASCFQTGYRGRIGIFEILIVDREIRKAISEGMRGDALMRLVHEKSTFTSLGQNCARLVLDGTTTIEEARRTMNSTEDL